MPTRCWLAVTLDNRVRYVVTAAHDDAGQVAAVAPPVPPQVWHVPDRGDGLAELRGPERNLKCTSTLERIDRVHAERVVRFVELDESALALLTTPVVHQLVAERTLYCDDKDNVTIGAVWEPQGLGYSVRLKALEVRPTKADPALWEAEQSPGKFTGAFATKTLAEAARPTSQEWWFKTAVDPLADPLPALDERAAHLAADIVLKAAGK